MTRAGLGILLLPLTVFSVSGAMIDVKVDETKMGNLDQSTTNCANNGCGPTAAVNSFVFLQNMYPGIYDNKLVPAAPPNTTPNPNQAVVANMLLGADFMKTDCAGCGTDIRDFILGKEKYIELKVPGMTKYMAQVNDTWALPNGPAKPGYVQQNTAPTIDFLSSEIDHKEDVELFIKFEDGTGHYITLTSLKWNTETKMGSIGFIDPDEGVGRSSDISQVGAGAIKIKLKGADGSLTDGTIFAAVSESPTPEPATLVLVSAAMAVGAFGIKWRRRISGSSSAAR